jgi:hypothetical protein
VGSTVTHLDDLAVWQLELLPSAAVVLLLLGRVERQITCLLLDRAHNLLLCRGVQVVAALTEEQLQVVCHVTDVSFSVREGPAYRPARSIR